MMSRGWGNTVSKGKYSAVQGKSGPVVEIMFLSRQFEILKITIKKTFQSQMDSKPKESRSSRPSGNVVLICLCVCLCVCVCVCACVCVCVCVYLFIKLHITAQSGLVILVILCHSR